MIQSTIHIPLMNQGDNFVGPFEVIRFFFLGKNYFIIKRKFYLKFCLYRLSEHFLELFQINHTQPLLIHIIKQRIYLFLRYFGNFIYPADKFINNNKPVVINIDLLEKIFIRPTVHSHCLFEFYEDFPSLCICQLVVGKGGQVFETLSGDG